MVSAMIAGDKFKQTAVINTLRGCQLFSGLPAADLRKIADITVLKKLTKGDYLFREGDPAAGFFVVQSGSLNVHRLNPSGKEQVIHVFRAGESFAEATLATDGGYPADSRALEPCQVLLVQKTEFTALIKRQPELGLRMLGSMAMHLRVLLGRLDDLTARDVETRLARWLVKRCPQPPSDIPHVIDLPMTKRVLASELGTVSETFSRTLAKFRDQNLIEVHGKAVTIHSPAKLDRLARERFDE
jgi:CRP/FNR family transcriptional regulator